ncbi:MAG: hypothetical protein HFE94_04275 [Acutalibacter sp.]|nr:hypothetical protein [Acutalibacter sp.]
MSVLKKGMLWGLALSLAGCLSLGAVYGAGSWSWALSSAVTCGTIACHLLLRFLAPALLAFLGQSRPDPGGWWFRPRPWEAALYRALKVKRWNRKGLTYSSETFDLRRHPLEDLLSSMCHAELVHQLGGGLGFATLLLAIPFGDFPLFLFTALLAAAFDGYFVIIQRYNRPRMEAVLRRKSQRK